MACACIEDSEKEILEHLKKQKPEWDITDGEYLNKTLLYSETPSRVSLYSEFKYHYTFTKTNGTKSQEKSGTVSMLDTYCGRCGKKFKED